MEKLAHCMFRQDETGVIFLIPEKHLISPPFLVSAVRCDDAIEKQLTHGMSNCSVGHAMPASHTFNTFMFALNSSIDDTSALAGGFAIFTEFSKT